MKLGSSGYHKHINYYKELFFSVELFGSMSNFGISLGFPAGMVCERFGPRVAALCGLLIASLGYAMLWSTTMSQHFYASKSALQDIYYFIAGNTSFRIVLNTPD